MESESPGPFQLLWHSVLQAGLQHCKTTLKSHFLNFLPGPHPAPIPTETTYGKHAPFQEQLVLTEVIQEMLNRFRVSVTETVLGWGAEPELPPLLPLPWNRGIHLGKAS